MDRRCYELKTRELAALTLDAELLGRFPEGYRHLAYVQSRIGYSIKPDLPQLKGSAVEKLYAQGRGWLEGAASAFGDA